MKEVTLLFFASVREITGTSQLTYQTTANSLSQLRAELVNKNPAWHVLNTNITLAAINNELCNDDPVLNAKDEIAFFPLMTGG